MPELFGLFNFPVVIFISTDTRRGYVACSRRNKRTTMCMMMTSACTNTAISPFKQQEVSQLRWCQEYML